MRLHFGKYNGKRIDEVPLWYVAWLNQQSWFAERFPQLAAAAKRRLDDGDDDTTTPATGLCRDVLKTWRRTVLAKWHPDRPGGSHSAFLAVTDAVESLSKLLTERGVSA